MGYLLLVLIIIIIIIIIILRKDRLRKVKLFYKKYKLLIISEVLLIAILVVFCIFNQSIIIKEKDPHSNKTLKQEVLKKGETYTFYIAYFEKNEDGNTNEEAISKSKILEAGKNFLNIKEKDNTIKIKDINVNKVTVLVNGIEKDYKYGKGFSYYGTTSCMCGTPIVFENRLNTITIILFLGIISIDLLLLIFIKDKNQQQDDDSNNK